MTLLLQRGFLLFNFYLCKTYSLIVKYTVTAQPIDKSLGSLNNAQIIGGQESPIINFLVNLLFRPFGVLVQDHLLYHSHFQFPQKILLILR